MKLLIFDHILNVKMAASYGSTQLIVIIVVSQANLNHSGSVKQLANGIHFRKAENISQFNCTIILDPVLTNPDA